MKQNTASGKPSGMTWLLRMAWRDGRAGLRRLALFMSSIVLGIGALVSIQNFGNTLEDTIAGQSRELMGADFLIDSDRPANEVVQQLMDSLGGPASREVSFLSMALFPGREGSKLIRVRALEGEYPLYGNLVSRPAGASGAYQAEGSALLDATLMVQFGLQPGDSIKIGNKVFPIAGSLLEAPGNTVVSTSVAPAVWIPLGLLDATGLVQTGSRLDYVYYFRARAGQDLERLYADLDPLLDAEEADLDLHTDTSQRLGRRFNNVGRFLKLVAFIALLLGCLGIASSVHLYMKEKRAFIAILKCLGASRRQTFLIFLIQVSAIGLAGGILGSGLGLLLQEVFSQVAADFLPVELAWAIHWGPVLTGMGLGVAMAVLFGLLPLLSSWLVSPLSVLRIGQPDPPVSRWLTGAVLLVVAMGIWAVTAGLLQDPMRALGFVGATMAAFLLLAGMAWGGMRLIRSRFPHSWGYEARQALLNLFRPNNQTLVLVVAIGIGTFLISTLYFTQDMLLARARLEDNTPSANLILLDVQAGQQEGVGRILGPMGLPLMENIPIVTMRLDKIRGRSVDDLRRDSTSTINGWILNHEFRVTYRDSLIASERLVAGEWVPRFAGAEGPIPVSLSDNVARDAQVGVGDTLVFNVQGVLMDTRVASIREVDWGRLQLNFSVVFPTGVLESAPGFHVMTTHAPEEEVSARFQQELVSAYPNVSVLDIRQLLGVVGDLLQKLSWVIRFMAFFSILTGFIVLLGAVRTSRFQRIRESVLLRTLGASSRQLFKITALEYCFLGAIGSLMGVLLALAGTQLLAYGLFEVSFVPSVVPFLLVFPLVSLAVLGIGLLNSRAVLKSPPLEVLRREGV